METLAWAGDHLRLLDQTRLPLEEVYLALRDHDAVAEAIRSMRVRGAPAIGVAAAYGMALAARSLAGRPREEFFAGLDEAQRELAATRPTAVNLFWALTRMRTLAESVQTVD